ncbi:hypothetical protein ACJX0J_011122, partial [Zea mays]
MNQSYPKLRIIFDYLLKIICFFMNRVLSLISYGTNQKTKITERDKVSNENIFIDRLNKKQLIMVTFFFTRQQHLYYFQIPNFFVQNI